MIDRSSDLSQPVDALNESEQLKARSRYLRGGIAEGLQDPLTGAVPGDMSVAPIALTSSAGMIVKSIGSATKPATFTIEVRDGLTDIKTDGKPKHRKTS